MGGVAGGCDGGRALATGSTVVAPRRSTATATGRPDPRVRLHLPTHLPLAVGALVALRGRGPRWKTLAWVSSVSTQVAVGVVGPPARLFAE